MIKLFSLILTVTLLLAGSIYSHDHKKGDRMKDHFKKMDTDGDNKISKAEWDTFHENKFKELDKNSDGSITDEEMKSHHKEKMEKHKEK